METAESIFQMDKTLKVIKSFIKTVDGPLTLLVVMKDMHHDYQKSYIKRKTLQKLVMKTIQEVFTPVDAKQGGGLGDSFWSI